MAKKRANSEGNIRKRKDGRWEGRYTVGYDEKTGKRITKSVLGKTQAEVKEKLVKAVTEAESIDVRRADEYTLGTWLQTWYELYAKPHLRFSTAEYYRRGIELHITPRIGDIPLKTHIDAFRLRDRLRQLFLHLCLRLSKNAFGDPFAVFSSYPTVYRPSQRPSLRFRMLPSPFARFFAMSVPP